MHSGRGWRVEVLFLPLHLQLPSAVSKLREELDAYAKTTKHKPQCSTFAPGQRWADVRIDALFNLQEKLLANHLVGLNTRPAAPPTTPRTRPAASGDRPEAYSKYITPRLMKLRGKNITVHQAVRCSQVRTNLALSAPSTRHVCARHTINAYRPRMFFDMRTVVKHEVNRSIGWHCIAQCHAPPCLAERDDPTQHAKGRAGDCLWPCKETATQRTVTRGVSVV